MTEWTCKRLAGSFDALVLSSGICEPTLGSRWPAFESMSLQFKRMSRICCNLCFGAASVSGSTDALDCHCAALFDSNYFDQVFSLEGFRHLKSSQSTRYEAMG